MNVPLLKNKFIRRLCIIFIINSTVPNTFASPGLLKFIRTVTITPDENFKDGTLGNIHYIPATDRFVVLLQTWLDQPVQLAQSGGSCTNRAVGYKEYTTDMVPTGNNGFFACSSQDLASRMIGNTLYFGRFHETLPHESPVWIIAAYNAVTWKKQAEFELALNYPYERIGSLTINHVNGQLVLSGDYWSGGLTGGPTGSHHHFYSLNFEPMGEMLFTSAPMPMLSMIENESAIFVLGSTAFDGDLFMAKYDKSWQKLETKPLISQALFPQGSVWDGQRFYIAYLDSKQRTNGGFPWYLNVHLAAYDSNWNLVDDAAVTSYGPGDQKDLSGPWVIKHGNRLFVSYIETPILPAGSQEKMIFQTYVSIYEIEENTATSDKDQDIITGFQLLQNYPNPFNPNTTIRVVMPSREFVSLKVYDVAGQEVMVLLNAIKEPGVYDVKLDAENLPNGVYFYKLTAGRFAAMKKLIVLR